MADVALVCVRDDAWKCDLLGVALERYGFTVCRSASVFEDFSGYAAVVVLLSPGAVRSELVINTASRALDWGKLVPVFVGLCPLPDRLAGVAMHDLATWNGEAEDNVVKAIAYHVQRLSGQQGRPNLGPDRSLRRFARESVPLQLSFEPNDFSGGHNSYEQTYLPQPAHEPYDLERDYARGYPQRREAYFVAASQNDFDHYPQYAAQGYAHTAPLDVQIAVSPNEAARRRAYYMDARSEFVDPHRGQDYSRDDRDTDYRRQRRPMPGLFTVLISATALMSMAWFEEARTQVVEAKHPTPAIATATLSAPAAIDPSDATPPRQVASR